MLVLTAHRNKPIVARLNGREILVTNVDRRFEKVRLGFTAPDEVEIDREKIRILKDAEKSAMPEGKTKSGLTPADLNELAAAKKTLMKFRYCIEDHLRSPDKESDRHIWDAIDELLAEDVT